MINNIIMFILLLLSLKMFMLSMMFIISKDIILIEWLIYFINTCNIKFIILIDWMMLLFLSVVMFISSMVMIYSKEYMYNEMKKKYFIMILLMFVISMIFMIISPNIISIILGWDGLGVISYCLIIYYQNINSYNCGMLTLLSNRIGDVMLLMMIFMMMNLGSWNLMFYNFFNTLFFTMFLIMMMTKSAQIPFSMWLPAAMAAPTPVSSLVHSSTLVTAGIYLLIRFNKLFNLNNLNYMIMLIGLMTMFIASINAMMEFDFKKIIAFSTLSQLGLMMMMMSMNLTTYVFFHLISHAMFKSLLFLCSGVMIHYFNNMQDIRFMGSVVNETPLIMIYFNFSNLSLCGFPFLSGYFSKDLLYEMILNYNLNYFIYNFMYICIMFTIIYSMRLSYYLMMNINMFNKLSMKNDNFMMSMSMFMLFIMTILFGNMMNWLMFSSLSYSIMNLNLKMILYFMMISGMLLMFTIKFIKIINKLMIYNWILKMSNFLFLLKLTLINNFKIYNLSNYLIKLNELSWNEYYSKYMMMFMLNYLNLNFYKMFKSKFIIMLMMFMYLLLMMIMLN